MQVDNPSYLAEKIPGAGSNMTLNINNPQTHTYTEVTDACPDWYEDLATVKNSGQSEDIVNEYYEYLKSAMDEALNGHGIPADDEMAHYTALIENKAQSEQIHQSVKEKLAANPRAAELMDLLGIA